MFSLIKHTEDANHAEEENHFVDEDTEVNIDFTEGTKLCSGY